VADVALAEIHVKVALAPAPIVVGEAANETVGVALVAAKPLHPVNKPVVKPKAGTITIDENLAARPFHGCTWVLKSRLRVASEEL
jgi:hypothetical protein